MTKQQKARCCRCPYISYSLIYSMVLILLFVCSLSCCFLLRSIKVIQFQNIFANINNLFQHYPFSHFAIAPFYFASSLPTLIFFGIDKIMAKFQLSAIRIPEQTLMVGPWLGGMLGAAVGMVLFSHKTRKQIFWVTLLLSSMVHYAIYSWIKTI